ncbi:MULTISPECIES: YihY/virulence factor BrkB family protein [Spirosoma]|uniref:YihY/virulence factor BrkB family protein n=1 Tax=Spirosoma liriopis TaxID=2937440 RepID=A0ABT0HPC3_9BACT|nr:MULTISPECIES: YihY/virulence factor BrkB family protein [Spirosoma]MCK8494019.1 YihY/virulence factor BrkB family protein [Spirosoma liriopis]UHG89036.1 YihY/virulence factor BrkB family protein [Spirosoma oryzicola]
MLEKLWSLKAFRVTRAWLREHKPFNSKISWYTFLRKMGAKIAENDTSERAASVSYSLILSVFPTVIFFFTLIPYIPVPNLEEQIMGFLKEVLPGDTFSSVETTIRDIISRPRGGVLSFGFLLALYSATSGVVALMNAFNSTNETQDRRGFFEVRGVAVGLTIILAFALVLAIVVLIVGGVVSDYLLHFGILNNAVFVNLLALGRYLLVFAVFVAAVSVIYHFGPDVRMKWAFVAPGAITASVLIVLTTLGFSFYVSNFGSYNKVYGSIGTLIALMIWINLVSLLLIIGFEMNVALYNLEGDRDPDVAQKTTNVTPNT